jgi:hypothetical protein
VNTKNNKSADASIKGYNYQFLHSIKDILESESDAIHTVEGIEDLDIDTDDSRTLIQYKYHETQTYTPTLVAEPIAIMFNGFINKHKPSGEIRYKLFIYVKNKIKTLPNLDSSELFKILHNKKAKIIDKLLIDDTNVESFISKFEWRLTKPYDELEIELIDILESIMGVSNAESRMLYLPNAVKIIINLAIKKNQSERQITKKSFIEDLKNCKNTYHASYILRVKGFKALESEIDSYKKTYNIKRSSDYIVQINDIKRNSLSMLIIELAKKFCYEGNDSTYRPITFIIDCETTLQYNKFKTDIHEYIVSQNDLIKINDGYDSYAFNEKVFNEKLYAIRNKSQKKYKFVANFNFKLIHKPIYEKNQDEISFNNPVLFIIDSITEPIVNNNIKKWFYLNKKLDNQQIINIIGS